MTRVLLYCRVSTDEQADGCSLDVQERFLRAYCANHGYDIIGEAYRDDYTGRGYQLKRPELKKLYDKEIQINIFEVKRPELDATIVANNIARQVEGKIAYRRAIKMAIQNTMRAGAEGIKVQISGRLNGAEIARSEMLKEGRTPLHTYRADIDYCHAEALTKVGILGIKVWICRGEIYGDVDLTPNFAQEKAGGRANAGGGRDRKFRNKKK